MERPVSILLRGGAQRAVLVVDEVLREVPVYTTLRYPERFLVLVTLAASAIAALGITRAQALARSRWKRAR